MKNTFIGMLITLALVVATVLGVAALAETVEPEAPELPSAPAIEETRPEQEEPQTQEPAAESSDSTALQDALNAYRSAKESARQEDLESELKDFVEAGKLTQDQADLILNYYKEQQALRDGTCPNCGYAFQNGSGKGGRMNGGHGGRGFGGRGQRGMFGQQPMDGQQPGNAQDGSVDGTAFAQDLQTMPFASGLEGI